MARRNVFAPILDGTQPASKVYEDDLVMAFMDIYPFSRGHTLIIPKQLNQRVYEVPDDMRTRLFDIGNKIGKALRDCEIPCDDLNFLINDGHIANQSVPHVHLHVVPRTRKNGRAILWRLATGIANPIRPVNRSRFDNDAKIISEALKKYL